ncbi:MAG: SseB family protein [Actinomycetota bacterium]|nr:SseB family protein [Actinomycetota bacterium]
MNIFDSLNDDHDEQERSALTTRLVEAATEASRTGDPDAWEPVLDMLYRATIILPFMDDENDDEDETSIPVVANEEGEHLVPVFTDESELDSWRPDGGRYTLLETAEILKVAVDQGFVGVVVNPTGDVPIELGAENIQDDAPEDSGKEP